MPSSPHLGQSPVHSPNPVSVFEGDFYRLPPDGELLHLGTYALMNYTKHRVDEVLHDLEQERLRADEDLRRFAAAAAYLRTLLPTRRSGRRRRRCTPRRSLTS